MPGKFPLLLLITLVLIAGCMTPAPKDSPAVIPATGSVEISSAPPGAEAYLDNVYHGTTPITVIGTAGPHTLELRLRDYQSWSKSIVIEGGAKGYVDTALVPVPVVTTVTLPVTSPATLPTTRPRPTTETATVPPTSTTTVPTKRPTTVPTTTPIPLLDTPVLLSPDDGQVFTGKVRTTTFTWSPVKGAESYILETAAFVPSRNDWAVSADPGIKSTTYTRQLMSGIGTLPEPVHLFRWRVTASKWNPAVTSAPSEWRNLTWQ